MEWQDEAILLSLSRHGETSAVAQLMTAGHGRHGGLVRGGAGKVARAALQPGNRLQVTWRGRLPEQLGSVTWELLAAAGTAWLHDPRRLAAVTAACALTALALPDREPHPRVFAGMTALLAGLAEEPWPGIYVRWELYLLEDLGFGLDFTACAATGVAEGLVYVSPKSGQAVSAAGGEAYRDRLLPLPAFLIDGGPGSPQQWLDGLRLTGYFLERHVLGPHGKRLPPARARLFDRLK